METHVETRESLREERTIYEFFKWSVILKGLISLAEVVVGLALLAIPHGIIVELVQGASAWLLEYANLPVVSHAAQELARFGTGTAVFVAFYLLSRGLIKCFLIWALLRNVLWAYPASLLVLGALVLYQLYEIATLHSIFVIGITLFDLVVLYFIWREWQIVKLHRALRAAQGN